jgi:hypothetical protein
MPTNKRMLFSQLNSMRLFWLVFALIPATGPQYIAVAQQQPPAVAASPDDNGRRPVLVELFTSEGCSSCPPADALLARLDADQFVDGARAIVLSEHVTYWDQQGWRDPYSLDVVTYRQQDYADHFGLSSPSTPQVVVDGTAQFLGTNERALTRTVTQAALSPKQELTIGNAQLSGDTVHFAVHSAAAPRAMLVAVLAEDETHSIVSSGENAGRTLHHVAVTRVLKKMDANFADGRPITLKLPGSSKSSSPGNAVPLRLVVFLADKHSGQVVAVAEQTLTR